MKLRDAGGDGADHRAIHSTRRQHRVEHPVFRQPAHLDRVLDGLRMLRAHLRPEHERITLLQDRDDPEIDARRKARVQAYLLAAIVKPLAKFRAVQERKMDLLLYLIDEVARD